MADSSQIMQNSPNITKPLCIVLTGPTAVGKTALSLKLADLIQKVEIVSCDSMAVYREMNAGTSKPSLEARREVKHHLIDIISVQEDFNAAKYVQRAERVIAEIIQRAKIPLLIGGSTMYLYSLLDGIFKGPGRNEDIREKLLRLKEQGAEGLYKKLQEIDPEAAGRIHPNDSKRIIRALEVYYQTGEKISELQKLKNGIAQKYNIKIYALNRARAQLYKNIDSRVDKMIKAGLVEEVQSLWKNGLSRTALQGHGYKEVIGYLEGNYGLEEAVRLIKRNTRRYAKRQLSWLRRDKRVSWVNLDNFDSIQSAARYIVKNLKGEIEL